MGADAEQARQTGAWEPERLIIDRYRVKECMRQSGTSHLYRVEDVFRGSWHLVLRPSPRVVGREGWQEWFRQYGERALAVPPHPNVLVCQRMTAEGAVPFLIMEDVQGKGWDSAIADGSLVHLSDMLEVALQVARGLAWLHSQGMIHCNMKPANVLVSQAGEVKVWKYAETDARTRAYASPEQIMGNVPLTPATDIWSWAVSVLHMFVGRVAWPRGTDAPAALRRYMQNGPARAGIPLMPGPVADLLSECFVADPNERSLTAGDVIGRLKHICENASAAPAAQAGGTPLLDDMAGEEPDTETEFEPGPQAAQESPSRFSWKRGRRARENRRRR